MKKLFTLLTSIIIVFSMTIIGCNNKTQAPAKINNNSFKVHYIDVGQGDSILVQSNDKNLLIDAGPRKSQDKLLDYLKSLNIKKLDYVIATHPHEDHIGGMGQVIKNFEIGKFYSPKVTATTKTYEYMINQLKNKNLKINVIKAGSGNDIDLGEGAKVEVFSPINSKYKDLNDYSPIMRISYNNNSFLFTGDAEKIAEKEVLDSGANIKSDVLKFGHHGSSTSTTQEFFKKVSPSIGVISCGLNNDYGHPHKEILKLIKDNNLTVYRTDKDGNVVLKSDGNKITKE